MVLVLKGEKHYRTSNAAKMAGISRSTLLRWIASGTVNEASYRDRRGWRLFTSKDIKKISELANRLYLNHNKSGIGGR